jgi:hypothetical protein
MVGVGVTVHFLGTRHLEATIQRHENTAPLKDYLSKRFNWCTETFSSIDWVAFSMAYAKFPRTRTFFHKFGWKQLPTGARLHRWTPSYEHRCPSCSQDAETDDHLFQCQHLLRKQWKKDLINSLHNSYSEFLDPDLFSIAKIGLMAYFQNCLPLFEERYPRDTYPELRKLTDQQTVIGWDQFVRGKWSKKWGTCQYVYAKRYQLLEVSQNWQVGFIRALANASFRLWEIRNGCRHGIDNATKTQAQSDQTQRELRCLYELRERVLPQDRQMFLQSVELHLQESQAQQRTWITHNKPLIVHSTRTAAKQARLQIQQLRKFFTTRRTTCSRITNKTSTEIRRFNITRIAAHFSTTAFSRSTTTKSKTKEKAKLYNTPTMSSFYNPVGMSISHLPTIQEDQEAASTSPQRRSIRRRIFNRTIFPDHPG